jgi:hypothetical protein
MSIKSILEKFMAFVSYIGGKNHFKYKYFKIFYIVTINFFYYLYKIIYFKAILIFL